MSAELTPWFPADVKPVRVGWYEREYSSAYFNKMFDWWDGEQFWLGWGARNNAPNLHKSSPSENDRRWRGLASDPSAP